MRRENETARENDISELVEGNVTVEGHEAGVERKVAQALPAAGNSGLLG